MPFSKKKYTERDSLESIYDFIFKKDLSDVETNLNNIFNPIIPLIDKDIQYKNDDGYNPKIKYIIKSFTPYVKNDDVGETILLELSYEKITITIQSLYSYLGCQGLFESKEYLEQNLNKLTALISDDIEVQNGLGHTKNFKYTIKYNYDENPGVVEIGQDTNITYPTIAGPLQQNFATKFTSKLIPYMLEDEKNKNNPEYIPHLKYTIESHNGKDIVVLEITHGVTINIDEWSGSFTNKHDAMGNEYPLPNLTSTTIQDGSKINFTKLLNLVNFQQIDLTPDNKEIYNELTHASTMDQMVHSINPSNLYGLDYLEPSAKSALYRHTSNVIYRQNSKVLYGYCNQDSPTRDPSIYQDYDMLQTLIIENPKFLDFDPTWLGYINQAVIDISFGSVGIRELQSYKPMTPQIVLRWESSNRLNELLDAYENGNILSTNSLTSSTINSMESNNSPINLLFKNHQAAYISNILTQYSYQGENEVLLPASTSYKVIGYDNTYGKHIFACEVVNGNILPSDSLTESNSFVLMSTSESIILGETL